MSWSIGLIGAGGRGRGTLAASAAPPLALTVWVLALRGVRLEEIGDLGLVQALPASAFAALALLIASFSLTLWRRPATPLLVAHVVVLIVMLYGAEALVADEPPFSIAWRHVGIADAIASTGVADRTLDAYFNWPGFFALLAAAGDLAGLPNTLSLVWLAPVVFNLLYLPPLVMLARAPAADDQLVWASVWTFYLANWIGQDYLSPQASSYLLYLALLAMLLTFFRRGASTRPARRSLSSLPTRIVAAGGAGLRDRPAWPLAGGARVVLIGAVVLIAAGAVADHQLTPFAMLVALAALTLSQRTTARGLVAVVALLIAAWLAIVARPYLEGHFAALGEQIGDIGGSLSANVGSRVSGSADHELIVKARLAMTALLWGLAVAGAALRIRRGQRSGSHVVLALAPFPLVFLQQYGGELLLRVYLFGLPFVAFLAASLVAGDHMPLRSWRAPALTAALSVVLIGGFLFTRYGNERTALFTKGDVAIVEQLYRDAPPGALLTAPSSNLPWQHRGYAVFRQEILARRLTEVVGDDIPPRGPGLARALARYMRERGATPAAYLVVTRSAREFDRMFGSASWGTVADLERAVRASSDFAVVASRRDGAIYRLTARGTRS